MDMIDTRARKTRCMVVNPIVKPGGMNGSDADDGIAFSIDRQLAEVCGLAEAIGVELVHTCHAAVPEVKPATFVSVERLERLGSIIREQKIDLVVVNHSLTPRQQFNLERAWNAKVLDRSGLILEIFGERAQTREGRLQVELAHLSYQRTRLVRSWTHLERQRGGTGFLGGPGETQLESDRRQLAEQIARLKKQIENVKRTRGLHRAARARVPYPVMALVGYTNAGKSTLFNRLTQANVLARDQLFATLDPTMRLVKLADGEPIILSDTVGFISDLPHELVAAFRATLEEVLSADYIVHVQDISDPEHEVQQAEVLNILNELGVGTEVHPHLVNVYNKIDLIPPERRAEVSESVLVNAGDSKAVPSFFVSAETGESIPDLISGLQQLVKASHTVVEFELPYTDGKALSWLHGHGDVMEQSCNDEGQTRLVVRLSPINLGKFSKQFDRTPIRHL